jgi:hypothetical protein
VVDEPRLDASLAHRHGEGVECIDPADPCQADRSGSSLHDKNKSRVGGR